MKKISNILRYHLIQMQTRVNIDKREQLLVDWADLQLDEILRMKIMNCYRDEE